MTHGGTKDTNKTKTTMTAMGVKRLSLHQQLLALFCCTLAFVVIALDEEDRLKEYHARGYTWPVTHFVPDTPGWNALMTERFAQIIEMDDELKRYQGLHMQVHAALLCPNFTEYGFGLARAPEDLTAELQQGIRDGLPTAGLEYKVEPILGPRAKFIQRPDLVQKVLESMQTYVEAWAGIPLKAFQAYGFRLYQNQSQLMMHYDRMNSHIVSFIYHIDSSEDAEPWPIFIEDYHGRTHEVILTPGDILFYESSKCAHGRPVPFKGSWYTSVFVHYHPLGWNDGEVDPQTIAHYRVPPVWADTNVPKPPKTHEPLDMAGMSLLEPNCPDLWCRCSQETVKWSGPGEHGIWIAPDGSKKPLVLQDETKAEL